MYAIKKCKQKMGKKSLDLEMKSKEKKRIKFLYHISILTNKEIKLYD